MLVDHHEVVRGGVRALLDAADDEALLASIMAGAAGCVLKHIGGGDLVRAIRTVGRGESLLDPAVTAAVLERLRSGRLSVKDEKLARLSPQEVARRAEAAAYLARHGGPPRA
jgi:DNA-binding NarL/FixJ family response regulator